MNEELIRQCAREANAAEQGDLGLSALAQHVLSGSGDDCRGMRLATEAIRLYHARLVAPLVEAANLFAAMDLTKTEIPHEFGLWVLGLRKALAPFQQEVNHDH